MSSEMELIQQSLNRSFFKLFLPKQLEKKFKQESINSAAISFKTNAAILSVAFFIILVLALAFLDITMLEQWPIACVVIFLSLATVSVLVQVRAFDKYYQLYTGILASFALTASSAIPYFMEGEIMLEITLIASIYCIVIVYTMTKLLFIHAVFWCLLSVLFTIALLHYFTVSIPWLTFHLHITAGNIFGITLAYIIEHREKKLFLNTLLLELEKTELNSVKALAEQQSTLQRKISKFLESLTSDQTLENLGATILSEISTHITYHVGAVYYLKNAQLFRFGDYALSSERKKVNAYALNESLLGAAIQSKKIELIQKLPSDFLEIASGVGKADVCSLLLVPIMFEGKVIGGMEFGSFNHFNEMDLAFFEGTTLGLGITVNSCIHKSQVK